MADEEPKIIVDSDWKQEAQREKDRLSDEVPADQGGLPEPSFLEIVQMIAMQAVIGLGGMRTPDGRDLPADGALAAHHIDLLDILLQKTASNLDDTERQTIEATVHELRMAYVRAFGPKPTQDEDGSTT